MRWVWSRAGGDQGSWPGGAGCALAEQGWVLADRGPLGDVGVEHWDFPQGVGTDLVEGTRLWIWGQGCGFGSLCNHVGAC